MHLTCAAGALVRCVRRRQAVGQALMRMDQEHLPTKHCQQRRPQLSDARAVRAARDMVAVASAVLPGAAQGAGPAAGPLVAADEAAGALALNSARRRQVAGAAW